MVVIVFACYFIIPNSLSHVTSPAFLGCSAVGHWYINHSFLISLNVIFLGVKT